MTLMSIQTVELSNSRPPVDESLYSLTSEEAVFFKSQTGIDDDETLKQHILAIQKKAYEACKHHWQGRSSTHNIPSIGLPLSLYLVLWLYQVRRPVTHRLHRHAHDPGFRMKIARMPIYPSVLELCQVRQDAILLDIGCCCEASHAHMSA